MGVQEFAAIAGDPVEELVGGFLPDKRLGVLVADRDVFGDGIFQRKIPSVIPSAARNLAESRHDTVKRFYVYLLASPSRTLYVGMTSDLARRIAEHKSKQVPGFTAKYNVTKLVHVESMDNARTAIAREKQIKAWRREKKLELIEFQNPHWADLSETLHLR